MLVFKLTETLNLNTTTTCRKKGKESAKSINSLSFNILEHQVRMNSDPISVINQNMQYDEKFVQFTIQ